MRSKLYRLNSRNFAIRLTVLGLFFLLAASTAFGLVPERRKDQFPKDFAYMVLPLPYSLPGLGEGVFMLGFVSNAFDTTTDLYGYKIFGGLKGQGFGLDEMPLGSENLMLNLGSESFNRGQINMYFSRGMESHQDEYHLVDFQDYASRYYNITLNMFDRRLELFYGGFAMRVKISAIRDHKANFLFKYDDPASMDDKSRHAGFNLDTTDDYYDPRKGLRLVVNRSFSFSSKNPDQPQFHTVNYMLNAYIHTGWSNTLALDYYRSMAVMEKQGTLDYNTVAASYCPTLDPGCLAYNEAMIDTDLRNNRYGTASSLGGQQRLRAYPMDRFKGAQTEYYGAEFRWNFSSSVAPFNIWIWKDIRTGLQFTLIGEWGTVAETAGDLWKQSRKDFGYGIRMITASGAVYRMDRLWGDEGVASTIIVNYPW